MRGGVIQDWICIKGTTGSTVVLQSAGSYADLEEYDDVVLYLDVKEVTTTSSVSLTYQTGPTREDASFVSLALPISITAPTTTPTVTRLLAAQATVAISKFLRWKLTSSGTPAWDVVFRVTYAAYGAGGPPLLRRGALR